MSINNSAANDWFNKGNYHSINGHQIFVIDSGETEATNNVYKPVLCILHGFPTSSFDYWKVLDLLSKHYRVILHDHLGFGFSDKPLQYSYSLVEQADIALSLWTSMGMNKAIILAHDYGTTVLTEILARDNQGFCPIQIEKVILCNGSMHIELAQLRLMQKLLRNSLLGPLVTKLFSMRTLGRNLKATYFDKSQASDQEIETIWAMITHNNGRSVLAKISQYTFERTRFWHRWIGALQHTNLPIEIIWPKEDPIAVAEMANVINGECKNSRLYWLENAGHFPMLETPKKWVELVLDAAKLK